MTTSSVRIFLLDDNTIFRESLAAFLGKHKDFDVVGHSASAAEARPLLSKHKPDILLMEVKLPGQSGLDLLREMSMLSPQCKTVALSSSEASQDVVESMRLGAKGFLLKGAPADLFVKCVRKVHSGEIWLNGRGTEAVLGALGTHSAAPAAAAKTDLSPRELEVIQLVIQGYKNRDIANKLFISEKTVKNHLSAIFNKLGVSDRLELTLFVFEKRLFSPNME
jgi:DNA-binding NarL/FixJ family response regulator